jgi:hypothetical protein
MKHTTAILAAAGLFVGIGTMGPARADNDSNRVTLYTSAIHTGVIACNAINVSKKKLTITILIIDAATGKMRTDTSNPGPQTTRPDMPEATNDVGQPDDKDGGTEGYCVFQVSGTTNPDDVRAVQNAVLAGMRTVDVKGIATTFPFFITRVLEAH